MISFVIAAKFNDDDKVSNEDFAKIGGVALEELCALEIEMLHLLEFNLSVSAKLYVSYLKHILS